MNGDHHQREFNCLVLFLKIGSRRNIIWRIVIRGIRERDCRVDVEDVGKEKKKNSSSSGGGGEDMYDSDDEDYYNEPNIDWASYDKCRFNCYRHFYITSDTHECAMCGVMS